MEFHLNPIHPIVDPVTLINLSYCTLLIPNAFTLVYSHQSDVPRLQLSPTESYSADQILPFLLSLSTSSTSPSPQLPLDAPAFHSLITSTLTPLILCALYSLPENWNSLRPSLSAALPFPLSFYTPEVMRNNARAFVDAADSTLWGLGGQAEKDQEDERRRTRLLLETGTEAWKERQDQQRQANKKQIENTFGKTRLMAITRKTLKSFETTLSQSTTSYFFSCATPTSVDVHLSSLVSLLVDLPLPQPCFKDLIISSFPLLLAHRSSVSAYLTEIALPPPSRVESIDYTSILYGLLPDFSILRSTYFSTIKPKKEKKKSKEVVAFERRRWYFAGAVAGGLLLWRILSAPEDTLEEEVDDGEL